MDSWTKHESKRCLCRLCLHAIKKRTEKLIFCAHLRQIKTIVARPLNRKAEVIFFVFLVKRRSCVFVRARLQQWRISHSLCIYLSSWWCWSCAKCEIEDVNKTQIADRGNTSEKNGADNKAHSNMHGRPSTRSQHNAKLCAQILNLNIFTILWAIATEMLILVGTSHMCGRCRCTCRAESAFRNGKILRRLPATPIFFCFACDAVWWVVRVEHANA